VSRSKRAAASVDGTLNGPANKIGYLSVCLSVARTYGGVTDGHTSPKLYSHFHPPRLLYHSVSSQNASLPRQNCPPPCCKSKLLSRTERFLRFPRPRILHSNLNFINHGNHAYAYLTPRGRVSRNDKGQMLIEKVRSWCDQPLDRGRLKNRTEQNIRSHAVMLLEEVSLLNRLQAVLKVKICEFNDCIIVTKSVDVEATGCEQLAQSRASNSRPLHHTSHTLPLHHQPPTGAVLC